MVIRSNWLSALVCSAVAGLLGTSTVSAQTYGTDYITFRGEGVILDNPTPAACQQFNWNFGSTVFFIYRWTANPSLANNVDTMTFIAGSGSVFRMVATQSPGFTLNGPSTFNWSVFNRLGNFNSGTGSTSSMDISAGNNSAVNLTTGNIKIKNGQITNWFGTSGCNITNFHGAAVEVPQ